MVILSKYLLPFLLILTLSSSNSIAQQHYSGNSVVGCNSSDETSSSPSFLYTCNGSMPSCKAFLMFRTKPPYLTVSSISNLTSSDPTEFARLNGISSATLLPPGNEVIVPVTCSCSGEYYQANTSYVIGSDDETGSRATDETYFTIANETYEGLATCDAIKRDNPYGELDLYDKMRLHVPLRCACPTQEQIANGTKFLLTFLIDWGDSVPLISDQFNVSDKTVAIANGFLSEDPPIYPFTTILIPLPSEPLSSQMRKPMQNAPSFPTLPQIKRKKSYKALYIGAGIGSALSLLCFLLLLLFLHHYRRITMKAPWRDRLPENFLDKVEGIGETLKTYTYDELEAATNNFSSQKKLSDSVYLGNLRGNLSVIKKMSTDVSKEIKILGNVNHFNLIGLHGFCEHHRVFYLVYEYLEEGSLKDWLRKEDCAFTHSWNHRILIALDIAKGLDYLHNFTAPAYVHKGINSSNILLNRNLRAKIANFSFARENGNSHTSYVVGEKGYMAPEYIQAGEVTPKIDVYAFGVVLLELITGREAVFLHNSEEVLLSETLISAMNRRTHKETEINELIDPRLQAKHPLGYVIHHSELELRLLKLSIACLGREPKSRLSMAEVVSALMRIQLDIYNPQSMSIEDGP